MAAPRSVQFIALRNLSRAGSQQQVRGLHMTGPSSFSPVLSKERPSTFELPRDIASLRAECRKRKIDSDGNKHELVSRLHAHSLTQSKSFSSAVQASNNARLAVLEKTSPSSSSNSPIRHFNTSRALKSVNDTSTIDFAFLPEGALNPDLGNDAAGGLLMRVPILPDNYDPVRTGAHAPEIEEAVMKPQISTLSPDSVILPMAELIDGSDDRGIDFDVVLARMANSPANAARSQSAPAPEEPAASGLGVVEEIKARAGEKAGVLRGLWSGVVEDVFGARKAARA